MNTDNSLTDRVKLIMENEGHSPSTFADIIGVQRPSMSHILSGRNKPSIDIVQKIITSLPHYNPIWLINGTGNMLQLNMFESEEDSREKKEESDALKVKNIKKPKFNNKNVNLVKRALESNMLDEDMEDIVPHKEIQNKPNYTVEQYQANEVVDLEENNTKTIEAKILNEADFNLDKELSEAITPTEQLSEQIMEPKNTTPKTEEIPSQQLSTSINPAIFTSNKKIEKIIVFYDDKTFAVYNPE